jgi:hypothetical protein
VSRGFISASAHRLPSYELLTGSTARRCESIAPLSEILVIIVVFEE